jgi:hypothetical protein
MNKYEKIKQMTVEEMADLILDFTNDEYTCSYCKFYDDYLTTGVECNPDKCKEGVEQWLLQEVEE